MKGRELAHIWATASGSILMGVSMLFLGPFEFVVVPLAIGLIVYSVGLVVGLHITLQVRPQLPNLALVAWVLLATGGLLLCPAVIHGISDSSDPAIGLYFLFLLGVPFLVLGLLVLAATHLRRSLSRNGARRS